MTCDTSVSDLGIIGRTVEDTYIRKKKKGRRKFPETLATSIVI